MSQSQEIKCLNKSQIETTMKNLCNILNLTTPKSAYSGKPVFSKQYEEKYNLPHITKFADNYTLYEAEGKNDDGKYNMYFIVLEATKFDKLNISACCWFYHLFEDKINKRGIKGRPQVYICPAYVITDTMFLHVPTNIIPCLYRFVSLAEMYPMIGSKGGMYGMTYDYKIIPYEPVYNGRIYPVIFDYDVMVKILNAVNGDLICCKRILNEGSPYGEYYIRRVTSTATDVNIIDPSGICDGRVDNENKK
jgi:hypothetical protein